MARVGDAVELMNGPECTGLLPLRMLPLGLLTNTNRPNDAQAGGTQGIKFVINNIRVKGFCS